MYETAKRAAAAGLGLLALLASACTSDGGPAAPAADSVRVATGILTQRTWELTPGGHPAAETTITRRYEHTITTDSASRAIVGGGEARDPLSFTAADGTQYSVILHYGDGGVTGATHLANGTLFAESRFSVAQSGDYEYLGDVSVDVYDGGQVLMQAAASLGPVTIERRPVAVAGPMRVMVTPCEAEWIAYAEASAAMIAAAVWYRVTHSMKALQSLRVAVGTFVTAWVALYRCMNNR